MSTKMTFNSSPASYKRRENPGQLTFDFNATPPPISPSAPSPALPGEVPRPDVAPVIAIQPVDSSTDVGDSMPEAASATLDDAPGYILSGKRRSENVGELPEELNRLARSFQSAPTHFITDMRAIELIEQAAREVRPGEVRGVRVRFLPFRATLYSFKMDKMRTAAVKFHVAFRRASDAVILQAARLMLCRIRRTRLTIHRVEYDAFVRSLPTGDFKLPGARRARKMAHGAQGVFRQLEESFRRVNETYFSAQLRQPELCWSPVRARRILGSYQERCDRLIVSRVFDSPAVPLFVLDFLMYHELLHKFLGVGRRGDGRRCMHGAEFKDLERKFCRFQEAQDFLKRL